MVNVDWAFLGNRLPIAVGALNSGYEVHIATSVSDRRDELASHGLIVHSLAVQRGDNRIGSLLQGLRQTFRVMRQVRPDIVHLVTLKPVLLGGIAARWARVPAVVAAVPGLGYVFMASGLFAALRRGVVATLYRLALGHPNLRVIFQNEDDRRSICGLARIAPEKTALIRGSGVALDEFTFHPVPPGRPVVLLAARLLTDKGVREFVEASRLLSQARASSGALPRFVLVGTPDPANPASLTDAELEAWRDQGLVELWGHRADMPDVMTAATIVVLPSYREGLPKVLIEAAAAGRAVVTTDVPGCRDAIEPGKTGLLVPVRDASALAEAIGTLLDDLEGCAAMGQAGRRLAESAFDIRGVVGRHLAIYAELLAGAHR